MDLTRRQFGYLCAGLYFAGGVFLLFDFIAAPASPGAHLPLAWHVFPVSLLATIASMSAGLAAPLDSNWQASNLAIVLSFAVSLVGCTLALVAIIAGSSKTGDHTGQPSNE